MSKKIEHRAEFVAIPFKNATSGAWIFKSTSYHQGSTSVA